MLFSKYWCSSLLIWTDSRWHSPHHASCAAAGASTCTGNPHHSSPLCSSVFRQHVKAPQHIKKRDFSSSFLPLHSSSFHNPPGFIHSQILNDSLQAGTGGSPQSRSHWCSRITSPGPRPLIGWGRSDAVSCLVCVISFSFFGVLNSGNLGHRAVGWCFNMMQLQHTPPWLMFYSWPCSTCITTPTVLVQEVVNFVCVAGNAAFTDRLHTSKAIWKPLTESVSLRTTKLYISVWFVQRNCLSAFEHWYRFLFECKKRADLLICYQNNSCVSQLWMSEHELLFPLFVFKLGLISLSLLLSFSTLR